MDLYLDFYERPDSALRRVWRERPVGAGLLAYALAGLSLLFSLGFFQPLPQAGALPWAAALWCGWRVLGGLASAGVTHLLAEAWGGRGSGVALFILFGLSELPWVLMVPLGFLLQAAGAGAGGWLGTGLGLALWVFLRKLDAVRRHYGVPAGTALAALLLPSGALAGAALLGFTAGSWAFFGLVAAALR